ncbi:MAG TPA: prephenate dehydrogenase/arogenate dehydrogenase family protein [Verrucomicrobiae bacterium]|nr:prephenate dehydrogenase/arogenate dehydrogenase family protein [Verrucomicrobiae bacterium]
MSNRIETVGFVGFGAMGQFMADKMFEGCEVVAHDPSISEKRVGQVALVDFDTALANDAVVLAVPAAVLHEVADGILRSPQSGVDEALLVDICSVKKYPTQVFGRFLPSHDDLLLCHPLFGPESAKETLEGHKVIVTGSAGERATELVEGFRDRGLTIVEMTADEHDRHMAATLAMPFILGRLANQLGLDSSADLQTPSSQAVGHLRKLDDVQSEELFRTATEFNPYASEILERLEEGVAALRQGQASGMAAQLIAETERILAL